MARGNRTGYKRNARNNVDLKERGSDESDEDYNVSEDEVLEESEDEYCSSLADDESGESVGELEEEEEEEWLETKPKKAGKPQLRKGSLGKKKNGVTRTRKKWVSYDDEEEEDDDDDDDDFDDVEFTTVKQSNNKKLSLKEEKDDDYESSGFISVKQSKKNMLSLKAEEDDDYEDVDFTTVKQSKKNMLAHKEEEDDEDDEDDGDDEDDEDFRLHEETDIFNMKSRISRARSHVNGSDKKPRTKARVSYRESLEDSDYDAFEEKPRTKARVSNRESLEDSDYDDFEEKPRTKARVSNRESLEDSDFGVFEKKPRTKARVSYREALEDSDFNDSENKPRAETRVSYREAEDYSGYDDFEKKPRTKAGVSYHEAGEESEYDDSNDEDDDDVEFTPDEVDGLDDEEESPVMKSRVGRPRGQEARSAKGSRRKRNPKVLKGSKRKGPVKEQVARKKRRPDPDEEFEDNESPAWKKTKVTKQVRGRRKSSVVNSDSDFVSSGRSDCEFTISEEEREQVKEASEFCKRLSCSLRNSGPLNLIKQEEIPPPERKRPGRKGKEKVVELKIEVGKPVCGICLSEEGKRTVRGILNCCNHYFCFACIMEWSKVESRCPLCKQRFTAISRTSRADGGHDLRDAVIAVPERDQVYQPSEEELRGYLDPYENVLCTECHQGGDDAHMLLCDLCDSPAHTYCVGLGQEVPEGNWYCDGCRPTVLASQAQTPTTDRVSSNPFAGSSSPMPSSVRETFDLNEMYVPETPLSQVPEPSPLLRHPTGDSQSFSPTYGSGPFTYGAGAFTLSDRRRILRQIHQLRYNNRSRQPDRSDAVASVSSTTLFGSQLVPGVSIAPHNTIMPMGAAPQSMFQQGRLPDRVTNTIMPIGAAPQSMFQQGRLPDRGTNTVMPMGPAPQSMFQQGRLPDRGTTFMYREGTSPRFSNLRGQALRDQSSASMTHDFIGFPPNEFGGVDPWIGEGMGHHHLQPCSSRSNTGVGTSLSPFQFQEATVPSRTWQGSLHPPF